MALIYIVEDDVNIREIETFSLKNSGYTVMDFECAKDFYHKLSDKVPDLILLDIMLPKMNGFEVCQQIREFSSVPIVMLTAKGDDMDKILGLEYGADDYITKPFNILEVKARIKAIMRRTGNAKPKEEENKDPNSIFLDGYICKRPVYRKTPLGREITDLLVAINRPYNKSDYIPSIVWGRNAKFARNLNVGDRIQIWGRIQSRFYEKKIDEETTVKKVAYEVSVSKIKKVEEEQI